MGQTYIVNNVVDQLMQDKRQQWINGKRVYFTITAYNEDTFVDVPTMNEATVKSAIDKAIKERDNLAKLTGETPRA